MEKYVVVIGGTNIDIGGTPLKKMNSHDSNPGIINFAFGGVARNIASNLGLLGVKVYFITAFGDDNYGFLAKSDLMKNHIDITHSITVSGMKTGTYLYINNEVNDLEVAISDMEVMNSITPDFLQKKMELINNASLCVLDCNISQESLDFICRNAKSKIFVDPVSIAKTGKLNGNLEYLYAIKPNKNELEILTGMKINSHNDIEIGAYKLLQMGVKEVYISLGEQGSYAKNHDDSYFNKITKLNLKNTTGAGDAMVAGLSYAIINNYSLKRRLDFSLKVVSICLDSVDAVNNEMSISMVNKVKLPNE